MSDEPKTKSNELSNSEISNIKMLVGELFPHQDFYDIIVKLENCRINNPIKFPSLKGIPKNEIEQLKIDFYSARFYSFVSNKSLRDQFLSCFTNALNAQIENFLDDLENYLLTQDQSKPHELFMSKMNSIQKTIKKYQKEKIDKPKKEKIPKIPKLSIPEMVLKWIDEGKSMIEIKKLIVETQKGESL